MNVCSGQEERQSVVYLTEPKQNDPKQTYTHISLPTNLRQESQGLATENLNVYETIQKKIEINKNMTKNTYAIYFAM